MLKIKLSSLTSLFNMSRRKKKSLFTRKKVSKPKYTIGIPADSEWKTMPDFASFIGMISSLYFSLMVVTVGF